jgi:uncharacterized membrane protein YhaH (DUF805 family)
MTDSVLDKPNPQVEDKAGLLRRLGRSNYVLFLAWFALILILRWSTLTQPPVWDGSMSVFPAAITLAESGFDLGDLLSQPAYNDGGPNVHGISLVTWLSAGVIMIVGDAPALIPALHTIHFLIAAAALTALFQLAHPLLGRRLAALFCATILLLPLVLTQAGYLYLEFPMLAVTAFALLAWTRNRPWWALALVSAAVLIKGSGIIPAAAIAGMAFFDPRPAHRNPRAGLAILIVPSAILALVMGITPGFGSGDLMSHYTIMFDYLTRVPDILLLLLLYPAAALIAKPWRDTKIELAESEQERTLQLAFAFLTLAFMGFYLLVPVIGKSSSVLPRYYLQVVPFASLALVALLRRRVTDKTIILLLVLVSIWSFANRIGNFYPDNNINNFALIERSDAYRSLLELEREGIRALESVPRDIPVFYDQPAHFKLSYPLMGYANGPLSNGHSIRHESPYRDGDLADYPDEFYMLLEYGWLGGEIIKSVWQQADSDPDRLVTITELSVDQFQSGLIHVELASMP